MIWAADTENTTGTGETYIYGVGIKNVDLDGDVNIFYNMDDYMEFLTTIERGLVYYHNLSNYDGQIVLYWLESHGYTNTDKKAANRYEGIITDTGEVYQIKITTGRFKVTLQDTAKLIQGSLDSIGKDFHCNIRKLKGTIDYDKERKPGYIMDDVEIAYLEADVELLAEIINKLRDMGLLEFITAGSYAISHMKNEIMINELRRRGMSEQAIQAEQKKKNWKRQCDKNYRDVFPEFRNQIDTLPDGSKAINCPLDRMLRKAYKGGYCYNNTDSKPITEPGIVLDVNSLYPSCMYGHYYPYGHVVDRIDDERIQPLFLISLMNRYPCFITHFRADFSLKPGKLPFVQLKNAKYGDNAYISYTDEPEELTMTSVDFRLFCDNYDIYDFQHMETWTFDARIDIFDGFVDKFYTLKANAKEITTRTAYKIVLNSSYGKIGTRIERYEGLPYIGDDGLLHYKSIPSTRYPSSTYIPAACFVTAYGRDKIIRSAQLFIDHLDYIDTDSLHLHGITAEQAAKVLEIDGKKLGAFDHESSFKTARFLRQKCYLEIAEDGRVNMKAGGLPADGKISFLESCGCTIRKDKKDNDVAYAETEDVIQEVLNRFDFGLTLESAKLMKRRVVGGTSLVHTDFRIHDPNRRIIKAAGN